MKIGFIVRRLSFILLLAIAALLGYLGWTDPPIDATAYTPAPKPTLSGPLAPNTLLQKAERLAEGKINGPEDIAIDSAGRLYGGAEDGRIIRVTLSSSGEERMEVVAQTGGRPLGLEFDAQGNLIVADALAGLLSIDHDGRVTILATEADGTPFGFTDDPDIASNGLIYFSDASSKFEYGRELFDLLESRPHGRLLVYDPATKKTKVLLNDLHFANGVALSQEEDFVLVNETFRYRVTRYWLRGPKAGTRDIFLDNLPGFPDGISSNRQGTFWVALFTVRNDLMDGLHRSPFLKNQMAKLPRSIWPSPEPYGLVIGVNERGQIQQSLHDPTGQQIKTITSVQQHENYLYLGTLHDPWIGRYRLR